MNVKTGFKIIILALSWCCLNGLRLLELDVPTHKVVGESAKLTCRCEVSAEAPSFRTKHAEQGMKERYYVADSANLTCYSRGSSPPASLIWKINGIQEAVVAHTRVWLEKDGEHNLDTSASNLIFRVQDVHRHQGLKVECIASIGPVYWHTTQELLPVSAREREIVIFGNSAHNTGEIVIICLLSALSFIV